MIDDVVGRWMGSPRRRHFCCHRLFPARDAKNRPFPRWVAPPLRGALDQLGVHGLYTHQLEAADRAHRGGDVVVATPTASGKTLCYTLPVFQALVSDPSARALYLFPTKALARDQVEASRKLAEATGGDIGVAVYDGDTPPDQRRAARRRARILATNPEMLHAGILPHHPAWAEMLGGLRYLVIDELHTYRGVFGSHLANVLRRLLRIARFHGADPTVVATSATIANPVELAEQLLGRRPLLVQQSGAPSGKRHFLVYNPPLVDRSLGIRQSYLRATCALVRDLVAAGLGTLVFCRTRLAVEVTVRELRHALEKLRRPDSSGPVARVRGYRGGYLPDRRREVEKSLREGQTDVVVTTSALELGIDIGSLDAVVMAGWPGSRAAAWQRAGRAGRRNGPSLALLVAGSDPVDQYVAGDPDYLLGRAPEQARVNPDNPSILVPHLRCAAHELPFGAGPRLEPFGQLSPTDTGEVLDCLVEAELLHRGRDAYHHVGDSYPAAAVNLRGPLDENFLVVREPSGDVVAEVDYLDAPRVLHEHAIYQLEGRLFEVMELKHDQRKAHVREVAVDYFTDALTHTRVRVLESAAQDDVCGHGEVHVLSRVVGFKKIKLHTRENLGYGDVDQPEREKHTAGLWFQLPGETLRGLDRTGAELAEAALSAAQALHSVAALLLMSDSADLGRAVGDARSGWFTVGGHGRRKGPYSQPGDGAEAGEGTPTIFLFDQYPGGTGLCERLFAERRQLVARTVGLLARCSCRDGCPGCIGPGGGKGVKETALGMLRRLESALGQDDGRLDTRAAV